MVVLMYKRILVPLEHSEYDAAIIQHVRGLAKLTGASVVLIHVADGFAARNVHQLNLRESEEMRVDRQYLDETCRPTAFTPSRSSPAATRRKRSPMPRLAKDAI
jgi:nucleotide-binding universal stress UspA family protein